MVIDEQRVAESADPEYQPQKYPEDQRVLEQRSAALILSGNSRVATS